MNTDMQTHGHRHTQTDTHRQRDRRADTHTRTHRHADTDRHTDTLMNAHIDMQTQTDIHMDTQTCRHTETHRDTHWSPIWTHRCTHSDPGLTLVSLRGCPAPAWSPLTADVLPRPLLPRAGRRWGRAGWAGQASGDTRAGLHPWGRWGPGAAGKEPGGSRMMGGPAAEPPPHPGIGAGGRAKAKGTCI